MPSLGIKPRNVVIMNNYKIVSDHITFADAELEAARLNYENGGYRLPYALIGQ